MKLFINIVKHVLCKFQEWPAVPNRPEKRRKEKLDRAELKAALRDK
jgi:hypothetical protein